MKFRRISADSHLEIRPDRYTARLPKKFRDHAPQVITLQDGTLGVLQEGKPIERLICNIASGKPYEERRPFDPLPGENYDTSPGTGSPEQRMKEQDMDGIDAEILFAGNVGPSYWRGIKNDDAFRAMFRAYNDWLAEEYCSANPDRLIGVGVIPMTNMNDAMAEMEHCKKLGLKAIALNAFPTGQLFPLPEDDKFWAAAVEMAMPVTIHVAFGFPLRGTPPPPVPSFKYAKIPDPEAAVPDMVDRFNKYGFRGAIQITQLIWAGVFDRFPKLNVYIAEVQIGWVPNWLDQLDNEYGRQRFWVERVLGLPQLPKFPSEYAREHAYWGFNRNPAGVRIARQEMGVDKVMWANDFPHLESDWPNSDRVLEESFVGIPEDDQYKMIAGNAIEFFHLDNS